MILYICFFVNHLIPLCPGVMFSSCQHTFVSILTILSPCLFVRHFIYLTFFFTLLLDILCISPLVFMLFLDILCFLSLVFTLLLDILCIPALVFTLLLDILCILPFVFMLLLDILCISPFVFTLLLVTIHPPCLLDGHCIKSGFSHDPGRTSPKFSSTTLS